MRIDKPDARGHFGPYGGVFVSETLMYALSELKGAYAKYQNEAVGRFGDKLTKLLDDNKFGDKGVAVVTTINVMQPPTIQNRGNFFGFYY